MESGPRNSALTPAAHRPICRKPSERGTSVPCFEREAIGANDSNDASGRCDEMAALANARRRCRITETAGSRPTLARSIAHPAWRSSFQRVPLNKRSRVRETRCSIVSTISRYLAPSTPPNFASRSAAGIPSGRSCPSAIKSSNSNPPAIRC